MLDVKSDHGVLVLMLNRPEAKNALCPPLVESIITTLKKAAIDNETRVIVLTGAPPAFTSGMDVNVFKNRHEPDNRKLLNYQVREMFDTFIDFPKPIIGAVNGVGVGFGATILGLCDIVIMAESAKLSAPFASLGIGPEACSSYTLPRLMGWQAASWFLYSSEWMDSAECKALGLALETTPDSELMEQAMKRAHALSAKSMMSLIATKEVLMATKRDALHEANRLEMKRILELVEGPACEEGMRAFFEKRPPDFVKAGL